MAVIMSASAFENVDFTRAAEATVNGVVSIKSYAKPRQSSYGFNPFENDPFFEYFFGGPRQQQRRQQPQQREEPEMRQSGLGSGVIVAADGVIVTNNHVIEGADRLEVTLNDNRSFDATVVGTDPTTDLAVIRIDADDLHVIPMGDSENLKVGEWVLAVGNPFGLTSTVTAGIVSAKARNISSIAGFRSNGIESFIQTDAAVNPGNSGGALVNLEGQLVGINAAIYSQTGNYAGNSFAIPTSIVRKVVDDINAFGSVQRAFLGIGYAELTPQLAKEKNTPVATGLYVGSVEKGSAAEEAGLKADDIIVAINGHQTVSRGQLQEELAKHSPGETIDVHVVRGPERLVFAVTLRNSRGNTEITRGDDVASLGCSFMPVDPKKLDELGIKNGLEVTDLGDGKFKRAGIKKGFIILDINNVVVTKADDVKRLYDSIVASDEYDHVMFVTGRYPDSPRKVYYAVDLADRKSVV